MVFSELADKMDKDIKAESIERRIQDFFQKVDFDYQALLAGCRGEPSLTQSESFLG